MTLPSYADEGAGEDFSYLRLVDPGQPPVLPTWQVVKDAADVRWYGTLLSYHVVWFCSLYPLAWITDGFKGISRWASITAYTIAIVMLSIEIAARVRVLNDRAKRSATLIWASLTGTVLTGLALANAEQIKALLKREDDVIVFAAFLVWLGLYGSILKLPWDRASELRKASHLGWQQSITMRFRFYRQHRQTVQQRLSEIR